MKGVQRRSQNLEEGREEREKQANRVPTCYILRM